MYDTQVMIASDWVTFVGFHTISQCVNWMRAQDPDGTVPMRIIDRVSNSILDGTEVIRHLQILDQPNQPEKFKVSWRDEGF